MRKILAIILAVAMLATFTPSAFAAEGEGEGDVSRTLNIESLLNGFTTTTPIADVMNYTTSGGVFRYLRSSLSAGSQALDSAGTEVPVVNQVEFAGAADSRFIRITGRRYICFEIDIPDTGTYSMNVHHQRSTRGVKVDAYFMDYASYNAIGSFGIAKLGDPVGQYDCDNDESDYSDFNSSNKEWVDSEIFADKELSEGKYIIAFIPPTGISNSDRYTIGNITLTGDVMSDAELGFTVSYDIDKTMLDNGVYYGSEYTARDINYDMSNGFFNISGTSGSVGLAGTKATTSRFLKVKSDAVVVMNINVPQTGIYSLITDYQKAKDGGVATVQVDGEEVGTYDCGDTTLSDNMGGNGTVWENDAVIAENLNLTAGEHTIRVTVGGSNVYASIANFSLVSGMGKGTVDMGGYIKVGKTALLPGEETSASVSAYLSDGSVDTEAEVSVLASSDTSVITVTGNTVKAVGVGEADIEATVDGKKVTRSITVADAVAPVQVSYAQANNIDDEIAIESVARGKSVTITAPEKEGYTFRHWVRGTEENGDWVSSDASYTFNLVTNTYLTAIYTKNATEDEKVVEFWNGNGEYIAQKTVVDGKVELPSEPKITGFGFNGWITAKDTAFVNENITAPITRAV
ncbi:MAG: InlB B-repeat-containing protein, partial [Oscillospiraceae bacterium]|nr:InlB B-repeat-containing protein [Oscillospiraceae bacterium]